MSNPDLDSTMAQDRTASLPPSFFPSLRVPELNNRVFPCGTPGEALRGETQSQDNCCRYSFLELNESPRGKVVQG